ncbi:uncharacterized protein N7482_010423 [Penicillium canariense]|uniref:Zn(2)-C6 fungal-type domain-containing protein n=1 Tax=Penicillium canariense TaxID=189055 RepID=A0A9W9HMK8_9EURO|nr:uncharacterized protein N7482_010423 [Penicillium canariense]KAJ5151171.1 hypothetical protein N7482_010423 [Penicillium canariense]
MHRRVGRPKSKTGCITCKIRHVKCDEEKPECNRCARSGRKCDGYNDSSQRQLHEELDKGSRQPWSVRSDRLVLVPGSRKERQYVHVFCTQATRTLSGFFPSDFWTRFLPQLSHRYPTIRHAVSAVGAVYERQLLPANADSTAFPRGDEGTTDRGVDLTLVTCLLFVCLETLRSQNPRALDHIQSGVQIVAGRLREKRSVNNEFDRELLHWFSRLNIQTCFWGRGILPLDICPEKSTMAPGKMLVFDNISQARESLTDLQSRTLIFIRFVGSKSGITYQDVDDQQRQAQQALEAEYHTWRAGFDRLQKRSAKRAGIPDPRAPLVLLVEYHTSIVWVLNCISQEESNFDKYYSNFEEIVALADKIIDCGPGWESKPAAEQLSLDAGVLAHLYWTAQKCRHPLIRRRAIQVLARCPARQGMWLRPLMVQVASKIVEMEEAPLVCLPVEERIVEEQHRVYETLIYPDDSQKNPCPVHFLFKPHGVTGGFESRWADVAW